MNLSGFIDEAEKVGEKGKGFEMHSVKKDKDGKPQSYTKLYKLKSYF